MMMLISDYYQHGSCLSHTWIILILIFYLCRTSAYEGSGYGYVVGSGFFYAIAIIFRFYIISYAVDDVKLAQSIYFYGSLGTWTIVISGCSY